MTRWSLVDSNRRTSPDEEEEAEEVDEGLKIAVEAFWLPETQLETSHGQVTDAKRSLEKSTS